MRPALIERASETEERSYYSQETHEEFLAAGFYRMFVPRRYGGLELELGDFLRVVMEIAAGDLSSAWGLCLASAHALHLATLFGEQAQSELFGDGDFRCPAVAAPAGHAVRRGSDWEISGTWGYCSGAPYATHYMGQTFEAPAQPGGAPGQMLLFVIPRRQWRMLDDWGDTLGLRGSGSHSIKIDAALVAGHCVLEGQWLVDTDTTASPGLALHGNPLYAGRTLSVFQSELSALATGALRGALEEYESIIRTRRTQRPPIVARYLDPDYQRWYGQALSAASAAETLIAAVARRWSEHARAVAQDARVFTREDDLGLNVLAREALTLSWTSLQEDILRTAGTSATRSGGRIERFFRDVAMDWGHVGNATRDWAWRELARERLGLVEGAALRPDRLHVEARA
jgi:3-hydroxy-9,10-secoandrosta-1,3,5(10)-triene-9,17-dione monooxygenase